MHMKYMSEIQIYIYNSTYTQMQESKRVIMYMHFKFTLICLHISPDIASYCIELSMGNIKHCSLYKTFFVVYLYFVL